MSETTSNVITYTPRDADADRLPALRLWLEPERVSKRHNNATLADIDAMLALVRSGASARNRQASRCGWAKWDANGDLVVTLALWVWPSDIDLQYSLTLPPHVTSAEPVLERLPRDTKFWVAGSGGEIELPWLLEDASFAWHPRIGVWDEKSRPAEPPEITQDKARLILTPLPDPPPASGGRAGWGAQGERYGVLWARGTAVGWRHDISIRYPKGGGEQADPAAPAIRITGADSVNVRATWTDENGETRTDEATLEIPDCVRDMLEKCPAGSKNSIRMKPEGEPPVVVYYNTCNGRVLDIRRGREERRRE